MVLFGCLNSDDDDESNDEDEDMEVGAREQSGEVAKSSEATEFNDIADGLRELDMDHYEEEGIYSPICSLYRLERLDCVGEGNCSICVICLAKLVCIRSM